LKVNPFELNVLEYRKFKKDASNGLSYDKMKHHIEKSHPRVISYSKKNGEPKFKRHKCWKSKTGTHCCLTKYRKSDFT
jgi:hypothetical protein